MRALAAWFAVALFATAAVAQAPSTQMIQQLEKVQGSKLNGKSLSMVMVIGTLVGCTQKQAGKEQTQAFYNSIEKIGKEAESLCQQNKPAEARQLLLNSFEEKSRDPVVKALLNCYDTNSVALQQMGGPQMAMETARYARWVREPRAAEQEMKESDVCHNIPKDKKAQ